MPKYIGLLSSASDGLSRRMAPALSPAQPVLSLLQGRRPATFGTFGTTRTGW